jgi:hypothetical protein
VTKKLAVACAVLGAAWVGAPAVAETVSETQAVGDEMYAGHDLLRVSYTNRSGSISATTWVGVLHANDEIGIDVATRHSDFNYFVSIKFRRGAVQAQVQEIDPVYLVPLGPATCIPKVDWDIASDKVRVRARDACFEGHDLSSVVMSTELGVRGKNNVSDLSGVLRVRRD